MLTEPHDILRYYIRYMRYIAYEYPQAFSDMNSLAFLKKAASLSDVAVLLGLRPADLSYALYIQPLKQKYKTFEILKKAGGYRIIQAPEPRLKYIQQQLAEVLASCEQELEQKRNSGRGVVSHGFKKKYSIATNAQVHKGKRFVFNADIKDFFPSINFGRVYGFFIKSRDFELHPKTATVLAQIACFDNQLPQGSPCSPVVSNLITGILDRHLTKLATSNACSYTRYADDLTFSTNERDFPTAIARLVRGADDKWVAGNELIGRVARAGFQINELKTRLQYRNSRQDVTGLVVNDKLNVPAEYYQRTRAMCYSLFNKGTAYYPVDGHLLPISDERLRGRLAHVYHIRSIDDRGKPSAERKRQGYHRLYSRFLDYRSFYGHQQPMIICEGKTDNVYIKTAVQMLAPRFPELVEMKDGKYKLRVSLFKYGKASAQLQNLSGGSGQLKSMIIEYERRLAGFTSGCSHPVMMVVDVDKGTTEIWKEISKILGKTVAGLEPFYHVKANLYVVPVPATVGVETAIEDLFDDATLKIIHDGKVFDKESDKDKPGTYSKNTFANQVIRDNRASINFDGFIPLLTAIKNVMTDFEKRSAT